MTHPQSESSKNYRKIFSSRSQEDLRILAQIKRFMERLVADPKFRKGLGENAENPLPFVQKYGIEVDPLEMESLWNTKYIKYRRTDEGKKWPLTVVWDNYMDEMIANRSQIRDHGDMSQINPKFHAWRQRQIMRVASELGGSSDSIVHPVVSYELSSGCTMGCWFCGISAESFKGNFEYTPENAALWQGVLKETARIFGPASQTGFCYWATDPSDNPDYDSFIHDHYKYTGMLPQTTTAAPLKNIDLTRRLMELHKKYMGVPNRFSVLSVRILDEIHETFSADELMNVELVVQAKDAIQGKALAGRAMDRQKKFDAQGSDKSISNVDVDHSTIACVSGFLVNMMAGTVQLVAPTRASELWPKGYRVYDTRHFDTAQGFGEAVTDMIDVHMPESVPGTEVLSFRSDLEFTRLPEGYELKGAGQIHTCTAIPFLGSLGDMVHKGDMSAGDVVGSLVSDGEDIFVVSKVMQEFYDYGFFNDDPALGGIGSKSGNGGEAATPS